MYEIDLNEIASILRLLGVEAVVADAGSGISCVFVGTVEDLAGTPRYTVVAGPGWPRVVDGRPRVMGTIGEFSFNQDSDDEAPAYAVREQDAPSQVAQRILRLHQAVQERRQQITALTAQITRIDPIVEPLPDEDLGGPVATQTQQVPLKKALHGSVGRLNLICDQTAWPEIYQRLVGSALAEVLADGPVTATIYAESGDEHTTSYHGQVVAADDQEGVAFADGARVRLDVIIAVAI